jgi:hypothetical protein
VRPIHRLVVLYVVLGVAVVQVGVVLARGQAVPAEVWGLFGAVVGYLLVRDGGGNGGTNPPAAGSPP